MNRYALQVPHVCFLGCGVATRKHARTLSGGRAWCSFASRTPGRAVEYRNRFRGRHAFGSYGEALADPSVDLVVVATPPGLHRQIAETSIEAGKAVAVEKPAFPRAADALYVSRLAGERDVPVFVLENYAYKPLLGRLKRILSAGWIGSPRFIRVDALKRQPAVGWRSNSDLAGGDALLEGGIHWVSFMVRLGPAVKSARVVHAGRAGSSSLLVLEYTGGVVGTLHYSWETPGMLGPLRRSRIDGTRGSVTFESNGSLTVVLGLRCRVYGPARDLLGFSAMWNDVLGALERRRDPAYTLEDARSDLSLLESARRSGASLPNRWETENPAGPRSPLRGLGVQT